MVRIPYDIRAGDGTNLMEVRVRPELSLTRDPVAAMVVTSMMAMANDGSKMAAHGLGT